MSTIRHGFIVLIYPPLFDEELVKIRNDNDNKKWTHSNETLVDVTSGVWIFLYFIQLRNVVLEYRKSYFYDV